MNSPWGRNDEPIPSVWPGIENIPAELLWSARVNFWRLHYEHAPFERVILFDKMCWRIGRMVYFVPSDERNLPNSMERHFQDDAGISTLTYVLYWHEFERQFSAPKLTMLGL